jgi:predicted metal-dependent phosphoesterase TrpH
VKAFRADLHIHTVLSPCAAEDMTPPGIVQAACDNGLALIAICDHNSAGNAAATQAAAGDRLTVIAGMELTTAEEVHVLGLFPDARQACAAACEVVATLPLADESYYARFGPQRQVDACGQAVGLERHMLAVATGFDLSGAIELVHRYGGIAVAAHVNRPSFSVVSQLGLFPPAAGFDAIEVFSAPGFPCPAKKFAQHGLPVLTSSDSHFLGDVGSACSVLEMMSPTFAELVLALRGVDGRAVRCA